MVFWEFFTVQQNIMTNVFFNSIGTYLIYIVTSNNLIGLIKAWFKFILWKIDFNLIYILNIKRVYNF